jgi:hypothetical protein
VLRAVGQSTLSIPRRAPAGHGIMSSRTSSTPSTVPLALAGTSTYALHRARTSVRSVPVTKLVEIIAVCAHLTVCVVTAFPVTPCGMCPVQTTAPRPLKPWSRQGGLSRAAASLM